MCCFIYVNGLDNGKGTHVSVGIRMMKGEFDSHLKWPFKGEITVELVNQYAKSLCSTLRDRITQ